MALDPLSDVSNIINDVALTLRDVVTMLVRAKK